MPSDKKQALHNMPIVPVPADTMVGMTSEQRAGMIALNESAHSYRALFYYTQDRLIREQDEVATLTLTNDRLRARIRALDNLDDL
jgi:hypothetical protein